MAKFLLIFGTLNKKLVMPFLSSILYIIMDIIEYFTNMKELHIIIDLYSRGISYTAIIIIMPIIQKFSKNKNTFITFKYNENKSINKKIFNFFLLFINYILYYITIIYLTKLKSKDLKSTKDYKMSHYSGLCSEESLGFFFIVIISIFLLKNIFYLHHYIGLILFVFFSVSIDIPFNLSFFSPPFYFIVIYLIYIILEALLIAYEKYMMIFDYSPYHIVFSIGLLILACSTILAILIFIFGSMIYDGKNYMLPNFADYFKENDYHEVIIHFSYLTVFRFFLIILKILTIFYLDQYHIFISYIIIKIFDLLLKKETNYKYLSLILFIFQFLGLLIFLEIIELNFCNLNYNTKRIIRSFRDDGDPIYYLEEKNKGKSEDKLEFDNYIIEIDKNENDNN